MLVCDNVNWCQCRAAETEKSETAAMFTILHKGTRCLVTIDVMAETSGNEADMGEKHCGKPLPNRDNKLIDKKIK